MKKVILLMMITLLLTSCSIKKEYVYIKPKPYKFQILEEPKVRTIRVHKEDGGLYEEYIKSFRIYLKFYKEQIKDYENSFKEEEEK